METLDKLNRLAESHGPLQPGKGMVSGTIALMLGIQCFLGVLAFHFPQYLTTPELRHAYKVEVIRQIMYAAMVLAGGLSVFNMVLGRVRWLSAAAFSLVALTAFLGGRYRMVCGAGFRTCPLSRPCS